MTEKTFWFTSVKQLQLKSKKHVCWVLNAKNRKQYQFENVFHSGHVIAKSIKRTNFQFLFFFVYLTKVE